MKRNFVKAIKKIHRRLGGLLRSDEIFLSKISGLIHLGANLGQERFLYDRYGLNVLWIEPNPEIFPQLQQNIAKFAKQRAIKALIADKNREEVDFNISSNGGESSSILDLEGHAKMWPEVRYTHVIKIEALTLPSLVDEFSIRLSDYQALVMDIQGAELMVLKGAKAILSNFKFIKLEVPDFTAYSGCCTVVEVDAFMRSSGFVESSRCEFMKCDGVGCYYDIVYSQS